MRRGWWVLRRRLVCGGILVGLMAVAVAAEMPGRVAEQEGLKLKVDHKYIPKPEELKYVFATAAPVLRIQPGDTVQTWTQSALGDYLQKPGDSLPADFRPNPNTGPFYVEGAEPGDTLAVTLLLIAPASDTAVGIAGPGFGALTQTRFTPMLDEPIEDKVWFYRIDVVNQTVEYAANDSDFTVKLPLRPFLGCLAVAPAAGEARQTIVPGFFGGNMDTPEVRAGTTVYLPVNVAGGLLYLGDGHAAQGEGEIAGTAAESWSASQIREKPSANRRETSSARMEAPLFGPVPAASGPATTLAEAGAPGPVTALAASARPGPTPALVAARPPLERESQRGIRSVAPNHTAVTMLSAAVAAAKREVESPSARPTATKLRLPPE